MKNLFKTVMLITIFSIITRLLGFLFRIYLSRVIGAESLGVYQIGFSVFIVLVTLTASGLPLLISRLTATYDTLGQKAKKYEMITSAVILSLVSSLILIAIMFCFSGLFSHLFTDERCGQIILVLLPAVVFTAIYSVFRGVMWGENNYFSICVVELVEQIIRIVVCCLLLVFFLQATDGSIIASYSLTISCFFSCLIILIYYFKKGGKFTRKNHDYKSLIKSSAPITGLRLVASLVQPLVSIIVPLGLVASGYTNEQALTLFGIAMGMAFPLLFLPTTIIDSLSVALIPDLASALAKNESTHIQQQIKSSLVFSGYTACLCLPLFSALGEPLCIFLFDSGIAGDFLQRASIVMLPLSFSGITSTMLNSLNYEKQSLFNFLIACLFLIFAIVFLPNIIGINAIIVAVGLQTTINTLLNIRLLCKTNHLKIKELAPIIYLFIITIPTHIITKNCYELLSLFLPNVLSLIICGTLAVIIFVMLCHLFEIVTIQTVIMKFKNKGKKKLKGA